MITFKKDSNDLTFLVYKHLISDYSQSESTFCFVHPLSVEIPVSVQLKEELNAAFVFNLIEDIEQMGGQYQLLIRNGDDVIYKEYIYID